MTVSWKEPADDGKSTILGYMLEKKESKELNWTKMNRKPMTERTLEVAGLTEGVEYEFRVTAVNVAGLSKPSEPSAAAIAQNPFSESHCVNIELYILSFRGIAFSKLIKSSSAPPGPVVNPCVTDTSSGTISLSWTGPTNNGGSPVIGYLVECKRTDTTDWIRCNVPRNLQETHYTIQNLIDKAEYQCRVTAVNKIGFGEPVEVTGKHVAKDIIGMKVLIV